MVQEAASDRLAGVQWWKVLALGTVLLWFAMPTEGVEAVRCSFDPRCTCIEWTWNDSTMFEIRCPDEGAGGNGWARRSPSGGSPDIVEPGGSFRGNGQLAGSVPQAGSASHDQMVLINSAMSLAIQKLRNVPECAALFDNSPLPLSGETVLRKIDWLNGQSVQQFNRCTEPDGPAAYYADVGKHVPRIYVCDRIDRYTRQGLATLLIHEALHVAGQGEDWSPTAGPGDYPNAVGISFVVGDACNLEVLFH